jgi:glucose/arabinose dehydrogenase
MTVRPGRRTAVRFVFACFMVWGSLPRAAGSAVPSNFIDEPVVTGLNAPVAMAFLPDGRLLIAERLSGRILVYRGSNPAITTCTIPNISTNVERGLLGIAVDPAWPDRPFVYVHYTDAGTNTLRIARYHVEGDLTFEGNGLLAIDVNSRHNILSGLPDVRANHNGGTVRFGPDGMLYVSLGEDDVGCSAQDTSAMLGVILRLDVSSLPDGAGGPPPRAALAPPDNPFVMDPDVNTRLVWALGLRNPFRFHIDPLTGALFIADVGEEAFEEISIAGQGGLNFGWPRREAFSDHGTCSFGPSSGFISPIWAYDHDDGVAVMSAGVYRHNGGSRQFPGQYEGDYFFSDYYSGSVWRLQNVAGIWALAPPVPGQPTATRWGTGFGGVSDWAVGPDGGLWYVDNDNGRVGRISYTSTTDVEPTPSPFPPNAKPVYYDLQGRRVQKAEKSGLYFTKEGRKRVVLK